MSVITGDAARNGDGDGEPDVGGGTEGGALDGATSDGSDGAVSTASTAAGLMALTGRCAKVVSDHPYATHTGGATANVDICGLSGAVFWTADLGVTCDGRNAGDGKCPGDDPNYAPQTAFTGKTGRYLAASVTPYVVVPTDFRPDGLTGGAVVAVIYKDRVVYAVYGNTGPDDAIGEASYACAAALGVDPDPATGGTPGPVTYIAFLGSDAVPSDLEDPAETQRLGETLAARLLQAP
jgi:hypothetical protein